MGRFLLTHKGANAFWTDYILNYPFSEEGRNGINLDGLPISDVELFILERSPLTLAHRERFKIFQQELQKHLQEGFVLASIPCGCMRDLLGLNFKSINEFKLVGIDIDEEALKLAEILALKRNLKNSVDLKKEDAWSIEFENSINIITSNGLNVYESDRNKILELYRKFHLALQPSGKLIIGFLTFPPEFGSKSEWNTNKINNKSLLMEKLLFKSMIGSKWLNFTTSLDMKKNLLEAGFQKIKIKFDEFGVFPTAIAEK